MECARSDPPVLAGDLGPHLSTDGETMMISTLSMGPRRRACSLHGYSRTSCACSGCGDSKRLTGGLFSTKTAKAAREPGPSAGCIGTAAEVGGRSDGNAGNRCEQGRGDSATRRPPRREVRKAALQPNDRPFGSRSPPRHTRRAGHRLRERNQKLVEMAHEVIGKTHKDKSREPIFNKAVQFLAEALQAGTNGSQEDAKALSTTPSPLSPRSEFRGGGRSRVRRCSAGPYERPAFANRAAVHPGIRHPGAAVCHAISQGCPGRAAPLAAGQTCELYHMDAEAVNCFASSGEVPQNPQAGTGDSRSASPRAQGKAPHWGVKLATAVSSKIDEFRGKPVLIVFWASDSERFQAMLPQLNGSCGPMEKRH